MPGTEPAAAEPEASYTGGCHCGAVRFRVRVRERLVYDCNCSICVRKALLHLIVEQADFELLSGADALTTYQFGTRTAKHTFCRHCGIQPFYTPRSHPDGVDVNARCLDGDLLGRFRIEPFDGRDWEGQIDKIR